MDGRGGASKRSTGWNIKVAHAGGVGETEEATQGGGVCGNRQKPQQRWRVSEKTSGTLDEVTGKECQWEVAQCLFGA